MLFPFFGYIIQILNFKVSLSSTLCTIKSSYTLQYKEILFQLEILYVLYFTTLKYYVMPLPRLRGKKIPGFIPATLNSHSQSSSELWFWMEVIFKLVEIKAKRNYRMVT